MICFELLVLLRQLLAIYIMLNYLWSIEITKTSSLGLYRCIYSSSLGIYHNLTIMINCLLELGIVDGHEVTVADPTTPKSILIKIKFTFNME